MITIGDFSESTTGTSGDMFLLERSGVYYKMDRDNLILQQAEFDAFLAAKDTDDVSEGTNLYFTDERVDDRVDSLIQNGTGLSWTYDDGANTLTGNVSLSGAGGSSNDITEGNANKFAKVALVTINATEMKALNTTPKTLVSPGSGKHIQVLNVYGVYGFGTVAFSGNELEAYFDDGTGATVWEFPGAFTTAVASEQRDADKQASPEYSRGSDLKIRAQGADPTLGDGGYSVYVSYIEEEA